MLGGMQDWELRVSSLLDHAAHEHGSREIVTRWAGGVETRSTWADIRREALSLTQALRRRGMVAGDRVATLAMNHGAHLVAWYGITGAGCVLHTVNPRLFDDQLEYIVNHAEDRVLLYDAAFAPIVERLKPHLKTVEHYVRFDGEGDDPSFADWLAAEDGDAEWSMGDERDACMLCYTSGTTGHPKGVLYSHRSNVLHAMAIVAPSALALEPRSVVNPIVPMFHANNWGLPWACALTGTKLVYSQENDPEALCNLMNIEGVTHVAGVPTVWFMIFQHLDATGSAMPPIDYALSGGSAVPAAIIERLMQNGIRMGHAWGMTETSPIATMSYETEDWDSLSLQEKVARKALQGKPLYGCEVRSVDLTEKDREVPRDGVTAGALQVRGAWVLKRYFRAEKDATDADGWFETGDVAAVEPDGSVRLTDRTKDLIKSGGEWISSVDLENAAVAHPAVAEAAAIGVFHPRWDERPILVVVRKPGMDVSAQDLKGFLSQHVARWWLPDAIEFVDELPHTGTGKISKKDLREHFREYKLAE